MRKRKKARETSFDPRKAKTYTERVKALFVERQALNADISDVCEEAKDDGLEPTFIRFAAQESLKDEDVRAERDEKRALYLHALGLAVDAVQSGEMSARQASSVYGVGKSSVYKALSVRDLSAGREMEDDDIGQWLPPHDVETGELAREMSEDDLGDPLLIVDRPRAEFREKVRGIATNVKLQPQEAAPALPVEEDTLEFLPDLDRRRERVAP